MVLAAVSLAVTLVVAGLVLRVTVLGDGNTRLGEALSDGTSLSGINRSYTVLLPYRTITVEVTAPLDDVEGHRVRPGADDPDLVAGHGRSLLGLEWTDRIMDRTVDLPGVVVTLVAGGRRTGLGEVGASKAVEGPDVAEPPEPPPPAFYVPVEGEGEDAVVEVTFDGVTQVVDLASGEIDTGLAAPLYEPERWYAGDGDCSARAPASSGLSADRYECSTSSVVLTPWRAGLGWVADEEHSWATVRWSTVAFPTRSVGSARSRSTELVPRTVEVALELDGADPVDADGTTGVDYSAVGRGYAVWSVTQPPETLAVTQRYRLTSTSRVRPRLRVTLDLADSIELTAVG